MKFGFFLSLACIAAAAPAAQPQPVTIVAHRGLSEGVPENTLAAFRDAISRGVAIIELDLRTTRDGQLVVIHDESVDRTTDGRGRVADLTLAEIRKLDAGWPTHSGERVPTFAEVLDLVRDTPARLLVDLKAAPLDKVIGEIRAHRVEAKLILGLRRAPDVARVRAELPTVTTLAFMPEVADAPAFAAAGAHIIRLWSDWIEADPTHIGRVRVLGPEVWIMVGRKLPRKERDWRALHNRMLTHDVQGMITDRPELVSAP